MLLVSKILQTASPAFPRIYQSLCSSSIDIARRNFSSSASRIPPIVCTTIKSMDAKESKDFASNLSAKFRLRPLGNRIDLGDRQKVLCVKNEDVELVGEDQYGQVLVVSGGGNLKVRYGRFGIAPSASTSPLDLLENSIPIPQYSVVVLDIQKHVAFLLDSEHQESDFALASCELGRVYDHEENIKDFRLIRFVN